MQLRLLRHATLDLEYGGRRLLVDPMLSPAGALDPVANAASSARIPLVELPLDQAELDAVIGRLDGVLVTHVHRDHWDTAAVARLPKALPILAQPADADRFRQDGYSAVTPVAETTTWLGLAVARTGGRHGTGEIGERMGTVSGFVLRAPGEPTLYLAGDTVWCDEVERAIAAHRPDVIVVNAGAAQFLTGGPITMDAGDVVAVRAAAPRALVVAVHFEAVNHCLLTRDALRAELTGRGLGERVYLPADGEALHFGEAAVAPAERRSP
jgi:L-ascorbate metabolism protein UlaG (beta-lactamase superfamily)